MGCSRCQTNRRAVAARREAFMKKKHWDLQQRCNQGDERSCRTLAELIRSQEYREQNRYRPELYQRRNQNEGSV